MLSTRLGTSNNNKCRKLAPVVLVFKEDVSSEEDEHEEEMTNPHAKDDFPALHALISMQKCDGYWGWDHELLQALGLDAESAKSKLQTSHTDLTGKNSGIWSLPVWKEDFATCLVGHFLQTQLSDSEDIWELLKEKVDIRVQK